MCPAIKVFEKGTIIPGYYDAVYIPVSGFGEISTVAPAYFSSQIKLPLLGTSDWNNEKALSDNKAYIKKKYILTRIFILKEIQINLNRIRMIQKSEIITSVMTE